MNEGLLPVSSFSSEVLGKFWETCSDTVRAKPTEQERDAIYIAGAKHRHSRNHLAHFL